MWRAFATGALLALLALGVVLVSRALPAVWTAVAEAAPPAPAGCRCGSACPCGKAPPAGAWWLVEGDKGGVLLRRPSRRGWHDRRVSWGDLRDEFGGGAGWGPAPKRLPTGVDERRLTGERDK